MKQVLLLVKIISLKFIRTSRIGCTTSKARHLQSKIHFYPPRPCDVSSVCKCSVTSHKNFKGRGRERPEGQRCSANQRTEQGHLTNQRPGISSQLWLDEKIVSSRCLDLRVKISHSWTREGERGFYFSHYVKCCVSNFCPSGIF